MDGISDIWKSGIVPIADSLFIFTDYSFNSVVENTLDYSQQLIRENGGSVNGNTASIKIQEPVAPKLEVAFPDVVADYQLSVFDDPG